MALCLDMYECTNKNFYLNDHKFTITNLYETEEAFFCKVISVQGEITLTFLRECSILIDGHKVKMWLGNGTNVQRNIANICFEASKDHVRILTGVVYERIQRQKAKV